MIPSMSNIQQAKDAVKTMMDGVNQKYHEDFDKIAEEFKSMQNYINAVEEKWDVRLDLIEKRVTKLEKERQGKTNTLQDTKPS